MQRLMRSSAAAARNLNGIVVYPCSTAFFTFSCSYSLFRRGFMNRRIGRLALYLFWLSVLFAFIFLTDGVLSEC
jgi:hypothetical protein